VTRSAPGWKTSACLAPDRKFNVSIPRTSLQSKSSRLALAATGVAAVVAILVSGGVAAAGSGPVPGYRLAAGGTVSLIKPVAGQATGQHKLAAHRKPAARLRLSVGDRLAGATSGNAAHRSGQHRTSAHHGRTARANRQPARARHRVSVCADSRLHWWICHVERVLERHGTPRGRLSTGAAYIVVQHESGANPHAYNGWDINAAQGHPSEGIAQVIGPTFHAYALPGYGNIWNPVDNMIAAFRYAISRYGSMNNIPGVVAVRQGGSYVGY
jgi:Transglycosylase SLT domain